MAIESINPATGERLRSYPALSAREAIRRLERAEQAFVAWRRAPFAQRAAILRAAGERLRQRADASAVLMAQEMGKPVTQGRAEVEKCAWACDYYAEHAEHFLAPEPMPTDASKSFVAFEPLGIILAVMPWNFPFWQVFRAAVPALMAGNAVALKHASNVPGCALAIEELFREAGLPEGLCSALLVETAAVGDLIAHPLVAGVTLTGSTQAGGAVAAQAGRHLKKTVLELGGSDPYLILADADIEAAAAACAASRLVNSGQSCIAAKRFIVEAPVRRRFEERLVATMREARMGDPLDEAVAVGPLARHDLREVLHRQVTQSLAAGARCLLGGTIPDSPGAYYPPTVLTDVRKGMPAYEEETFGPVAAVLEAADEAEAVRLANDSRFGLGAAVFTGDPHRGERIAVTQLEAGACFVNGAVHSDPRLPFGGVKRSGYGRELGMFGIREFVNVKAVSVR
ncbi:MAG: NAD-dependent succinate-semialdehyde dehydrogenase [Candidatus Rokubacteria bacterium]|nr:NAD-dependent succinate-semialdehyde dehydrogenase [Candidatus Rokubacteria bacterium]